ncbi:Inositol-1-monophosphatase [Methylophaga frappieri]|uniref:Inositol-1-monophosphatase n=1 Tax=Methylophaga frappieri (strain ATCC BAA-2434 / DSM 25690 / JAM7) TaxID=754477 RepID=I1YFB9_METFJ|nr:inositol-1-monophosphatase [Methylophaga frappieri]AFJ01612.1 Inositol-1-monophosphatase [Methylophaga frappieri]
MHPMLNIAVRAARQAGSLILRSLQHVDHLAVTTKGRNDFVSDVDRLAEQEIISVIKKAYPDHAIMAEESGEQGDSDTVWIIDPLDGTTNFLHGFPHYCVSIAVRIKDQVSHAVIFDPLRDELFTASRGSGAQLNGRRLRVTKRRDLTDALIATGFPFKYPQHQASYLAMFNAVFSEVADIRRAGSAALDLAYVAAGRVDGYWEIGLQNWDLAAGILLVEEAGGIVTNFSGQDQLFDKGHVLAAGMGLHKHLQAAITPHLTDALV